MLQEKEKIDLGKYSLIRVGVDRSEKKETVAKSVHHIFVMDASGSMYYELPQIRTDLYAKVTELMKEGDLLSLIWFSSKGQFGIITEGWMMKGGDSLKELKQSIDRELYARGATAFKDPLVEVEEMIGRVNEEHDDIAHSLFFMTDGHDNQCSEKDIISAIGALKPFLASAAIIEYGYYCNRKLLSDMSMEVGGVHVFSSDFNDYEPYLKKQFSQKIRSQRAKVNVGKVHGDILFSKKDDDIIIYKVDNEGGALVDLDGGDLFYLVPSKSNDVPNSTSTFFKDVAEGKALPNEIETAQSAYSAMFAFSRKSDYNTISDILRAVGDAYLIKKKANTFGSQKINELEADFSVASNDRAFMYLNGYDPTLEPKEDAYCVMDLIDDLMEYDDNLWYPGDPAFSYKRIGRKAILAGKKTSKDEKEALKLLIENNKNEEAMKKLQEINDEPKALKFVRTNSNAGHPIHNLVWNNSRANLSVQVTFEGTVELPENDFGLPTIFETKQFRNFTIIKDGIINTYRLPVSLNEKTFEKLQQNDLLAGETYEPGKIYVLDFSDLPVINQKMVKETSAKKLFEDQFKLSKLQARNSVFNHLKKAYFSNVSIDFSAKYGDAAAAWLKELGITPNGFAPKTTLEPTTEETVVNTLSVKIDKMTIPNTKKDFESVMSKMEKGMGLTPREKLLEAPILEFQAFEKMSDNVSDDAKKTLIETWLTARSNEIRKEKSKLMNSISRTQFVTIVGKSWFSDLDSRDDKEMLLEMDGEERKFIINDKMETIKI